MLDTVHLDDIAVNGTGYIIGGTVCLKITVTSAKVALAMPITSKPSIAASALVPAAVAGIDRPITTTVAAVEITDAWKSSVFWWRSVPLSCSWYGCSAEWQRLQDELKWGYMMPKDYGYFGKGISGYAHYMQSFNENNGGGGHGGGSGGDGSGCFLAILAVIVVLALLGVK